ncbi:putative peptidoglycan binding protein [Streptomyces sp. CEV 2-1]|nr:putative peptidoglycan binding protein [Streptomyces sp. CEV 2-1]
MKPPSTSDRNNHVHHVGNRTMRTAAHRNRLVASAAMLVTALSAGAAATAAPHVPVAATTTGTVAPAAAAQASWPTVKSGQRGVDVTTVQLLLTARGHATKADGVFGPGTVAKVKAFQKAQRLTADGVVGPSTWSRLVTTVKTARRAQPSRPLQHQLTANGHTIIADGVLRIRDHHQGEGLPEGAAPDRRRCRRPLHLGRPDPRRRSGGGGGNPGGGGKLRRRPGVGQA